MWNNFDGVGFALIRACETRPLGLFFCPFIFSFTGDDGYHLGVSQMFVAGKVLGTVAWHSPSAEPQLSFGPLFS